MPETRHVLRPAMTAIERCKLDSSLYRHSSVTHRDRLAIGPAGWTVTALNFLFARYKITIDPAIPGIVKKLDVPLYVMIGIRRSLYVIDTSFRVTQ
jgi:hypothetical protein